VRSAKINRSVQRIPAVAPPRPVVLAAHALAAVLRRPIRLWWPPRFVRATYRNRIVFHPPKRQSDVGGA